MEKFAYNTFLSQIQRLSCSEVQKLLKKYQKDLEKMSIVDSNQMFNFIENKFNMVQQWQNKGAMTDVLTFKMIATRVPEISSYVFEEIDNLNKLHPTLQVEVANLLDENEKINLLNNFGEKLSPIVVQDFILTLNKENQKRMMIKFKNKIVNADYKLLLTFIGTLDSENQKFFLTSIKDIVKTMDEKQITPLVLGVYENNISYFFNEYEDLINNLDTNQFVELLSMLSGNATILCSKHFNSKMKTIPADVLMYKLGLSIDDTNQIYNIWKSNPEKLAELSNTYFNLIISRLDDDCRLNSLSDFKERYNKMDIDELLNLFEFDYDEIKTKFFYEYPHKVNGLDGKTFIDYVNHNVDKPEFRDKIFLLYKNKICGLQDEEFIYFIQNYSEKNLKFSWDKAAKEKSKEEITEFIITNFADRLKKITTEFIPKLFSDSDTCLQKEYITLLKENIENLILEKTYIEKLLKATWGDSKGNILQSFQEQFKTLTGQDWYNLLSVISGNDYELIENLLLTCEIDNLNFVDKEKLLSNSNCQKMFSYFEKNIQSKLYLKYSEIAQSGDITTLMNKYEEIMTKVVDNDAKEVLIDYDCSELLILLRVLLANHIINDKDDYYQMFKENYMSKILDGLDKENPENINIIKDSIFYRLVKGSITPTNLIPIKTLKGLIFFNKNSAKLNDEDSISSYSPQEIESFVANLTEEQVIGLNNKLFKQVCEKLYEVSRKDYASKSSVRDLAIRLYLSVGYQNAKKLLDLDVPFTRYEYIFNSINIKRIQLNENGEPIINKKLNDFMFGSNINDDNTNINRLLQNTIPEFEKRFAEIYNGWETIYNTLNGNVSLTRILKWFEENKVLLNPDEHRLAPVLNEIGSDERVIEKARSLYTDMKNRKFSTIPKVTGNYNDEYTYEMLDLDDPLGLAVGYITRCCFLIDGASRSSLYHSAQSKDGRIFVVRKNGELIAQSWVWRNGNLVCFDNVETRGNYDWDILLETYKKASENILSVSSKDEDTKEQIKLVTFGGSYSRMTKPKEQIARDKIHTPRVDGYIYCDAEYEQYILASNGESELYYGDVNAQYLDTRKEPDKFVDLSLLDREQKSSIIKRIRAVDFSKSGNIRQLDFDNYCYAEISDDWYILINNNGDVECSLLESDNRARPELYDELDKLEKTFTKLGVRADSEKVKGKVLTLVKGSDC